ncbi:MAG: GNAT family N-acetyltransferase [Thaumarchaeota archaeon]|nr:GNAT family N-acetyltransferase [Nitrososphaerota archaeon]
MEPINIRRATKAEVDVIADLVVRLKKLNSEFDPLFTVKEDAKHRAVKYVSESIGSEKTLLLSVTKGDKLIGFLRAELRERLFYEPSKEGHITDMYVLPEHRRKQIGHEILEQGTSQLVKMGAEIIVAELPSRNEIGVHFYTKRGFRRLIETFAQVPQ